MLFYGIEEKKQIFSYKICMPFVWIILIKGRLTNQFFPKERPVDVSSRPPPPPPPPPLTEKRQWPKIPKNLFFFST